MHGIGRELAEDRPEEGKKKGERIEWSVGLTPLRELLSLPIRVSAEVRITEEDPAAKAHLKEIRRVRNADVTLGLVIRSLLWELSFHGGPQEQQEVLADLRRRVAEIDDGTAELISHDDLFGYLDKPGCDALFDDLGGRSTREITKAIGHIDDDKNAVTELEWNGSSMDRSWSRRSFATIPVASSARRSSQLIGQALAKRAVPWRSLRSSDG